MKKLIVLIIVSILCFVLIQHFDGKLSTLENIIVAEYTGNYALLQHELVEKYVNMDKNIDIFSICSDYSGSLKTSRHSYNDVLISMVDNKFTDFYKIKMVNGRFIWKRDIDNRSKYIVIEKNMASALFSTTDCVGREVELDKQTFTVIGVFEKGDWLTSTMSAISNNIVFIPFVFSDTATNMVYEQNMPKRQVFLLRVKNGISTVLKGSVEKNLEKILNSDINTENIDIKTRKTSQKIKFTYFVIACIAAIYILKWVFPILKRMYSQLKGKMDNSYFLQMLKENWIIIGVCIFVIAGLITIFYIIIKNLKPSLIIDTELIPSRLINITEISEKISDYFIRINTEEIIPSPFHALITHVNRLLTYLCGILIICCFGILHRINTFNVKFLNL